VEPGVLRQGAESGAQPECYGGGRQLSGEQSRAGGGNDGEDGGLRMSSAHRLGGLRRFHRSGGSSGVEGRLESPASALRASSNPQPRHGV
jgi:hypothetical protein